MPSIFTANDLSIRPSDRFWNLSIYCRTSVSTFISLIIPQKINVLVTEPAAKTAVLFLGTEKHILFVNISQSDRKNPQFLELTILCILAFYIVKKTKLDFFWKLTISDVLHDLVAFLQFKKPEKHQWRSVTFSTCNFTKSNTPPWVFFTFFKLRKRYHIAKSITKVSYRSCWLTKAVSTAVS